MSLFVVKLLVIHLFLTIYVSLGRKPLFRAARDVEKTGRYIVVLQQDIDDKTFDEVLRRAVLLSNNKRAYGVVRTVEKAFTVELNPYSLEQIISFPEVDYLEEEQFARGAQDPNLQWYLDRLDHPGTIRDYQYQPRSTGEGVDVYILDTGINYDHEEFEHRAKYVGYDPVDEYYNDRTPQKGRDCQGHGTHVASLAGGKRFGTAKKANLYSVRVLDCTNFAPWSVVLDGLDYVAKIMKKKKRPMIVSLSLSGPFQSAANEAVKNLNQMGAVVVTAAGNGKVDACKYSPASSEYAITVGGTNISDQLYWSGSGTNFGKCVDIFAPGEKILAANHTCNDCTKVLSGTSMSAPLVSGIVALYLQNQPLLSPDDIKNLLKNSSLKGQLNFDPLTDEARPFTPNNLIQTAGGCGGIYVVRTEFNISSPNYPEEYPPYQFCEWKIEADTGQIIELVINDIQLEKNFDHLIICDGKECLHDNIINTYTGDLSNDSSKQVIRSSGQYLILQLYTDSNIGGRGFHATFTRYYAGTSLKVPDSGLYLPEVNFSTLKPASTRTLIKINASDVVKTVEEWKSRGFDITWINVYNDEKVNQWFYDIVFHNSSLVPSKGFVELNSTQLNDKISEIEKTGLIVKMISSRSNESTIFYSVVFGSYGELIESHTSLNKAVYHHIISRTKLNEEGWTLVCQHILSVKSSLTISAVYHRDKRKQYNIPVGEEPVTSAYYGFNFYQFTSITLSLGRQNYYPKYISSYNFRGETESRFSVIYEIRHDLDTRYRWFRWGMNLTEVREHISSFSSSWDPQFVADYTYNGKKSYMIQWGFKKEH